MYSISILCGCIRVDATYSPVEVVSAIRGYVEHFLGCRECSENFVRGASQMLSGRSSARYLIQRDGAVIWLWRSHNRANRHLRGDITEDPAYPKVQFPTAEACPACHQGESWNETAVLQYLVGYYGAASIIDDDIEAGPGMKLLVRSAANSRQSARLLHGIVLMLQSLLVICM